MARRNIETSKAITKAPFPPIINKRYPLDNGSIGLSIEHIYEDGRCRTIHIIVTDSVVDNGGTAGSAMFDVKVEKKDLVGLFLQTEIAGNFESGSASCRYFPIMEHEFYFYGPHEILRGCFVLKNMQFYEQMVEATLHFGLDRSVSHAITVKINCQGDSLSANLDGPTMKTREELDWLGEIFTIGDRNPAKATSSESNKSSKAPVKKKR